MTSRPPAPAVVLALFFASGSTALVYEVVWLRKLVTIFGSTLFATSAILSTFMAGLALGALVAGRMLDRRSVRPLFVYGVLEIAIGLYALCVPWLLSGLTPVLKALWEAGARDSFLLLSAAKFALIGVVLLPPTVLMGASLPVLARQIADDPPRIGGQVGVLYAVNTFGAVTGTLLAGFVAIPAIGMRSTLFAAAALNLAIGTGACLIAGGASASTAAPRGGGETGTPATSTGRLRLALVVIALSGFAALALEVAWTRGLGLVFGSSVYAFSLMLVAFLTGLAAGGATFSAWLRRRPAVDPAALLAVLLASAGVLAYATAFAFQKLPLIFAQAYFTWRPPTVGWFAIQLLLSLMVMFPATAALGGIFPVVLQLHARSLDRVSGAVGTVYAANTLGTILGAVAAGFFLIPFLGVRNTVVAIAAVEVGLGLVVAGCVVTAGIAKRTALMVPMILGLVAILSIRPEWNVLLMNSGVYFNLQDLPAGSTWRDFQRYTQEKTVALYAREGLTAAVLVADQPAYRNRYLAVNGKVEASTGADMETQLMAAHLPLLLHPDPASMLIVGLASGITVGAAAAHPVERIRVVEVERAMIPAARLFSEWNGDVLDDARVEVSINDARTDLEFNPETYDVITSEPSNPWMTVASNLFTEDFFALARTRLKPDGIFCQWLQTYCLPTDDLRAVISAFRSAFPHVWLFETFEGTDLLLLGSARPLTLDLDRMDARIAELRVRMDLARIDVASAADVLPLFRLGGAEVDSVIAGASRNTDDNAKVEFSAARALYLDTLEANVAYLERFAADPLGYVMAGPDPPGDPDRLRLELARAWARRGNRKRAEDEVAKLPDALREEAARDVLTD